MGRRALELLAVVLVLLNPTRAIQFAFNEEEVTIASRPKFRHDPVSSHAKEWIDGPDGHVYQFHVGDQSWLAAREFCLSQNSELVVLRSKEQTIGLLMPDGPNRDWTYLDGTKYNKSVIAWMSGEPFDHSADGRERCAVLRVHARVLDDVDCESVPNPNVHMRFVCERDQLIHKQQQKSQNFIWSKLEKLLEFFGFSSGTIPVTKPYNETDSDEMDYIDEIKKLNISSKEREELKSIKVDHETSSEEQKAVESVLRTLNKVSKPGTSAFSKITEGKEGRTGPTSEEHRANTSSELLTGPITSPALSQGSTVAPGASRKTESAGSAIESSTAVTETTTSENATDPTSPENTVDENTAVSSKSPANEAARARAAPLKEILDVEGSGTDVERSDIEKGSEDRETVNAMENDFDEEASRSLPSTDIKPPEEECDEEASGEKAVNPTATNEEIIRNTIDTEDVDDLSQKPKIPAEKEAHIQDFLTTLRTFLNRAEHSDLRKLLDEHPEKTLLEKMKLAIRAANEREFERLKELELMKKHGVDISHVPEPKLMGETEREELYNKISRVVMIEAEKKGDETVTQPSARTTTQELHRTTNTEVKITVRSKKILIRKSSKEYFSKEESDKDVNGKLKDAKPVTNEKKGSASSGQTTEKKTGEKAAEAEEDEKMVNSTEPTVSEENTTVKESSAELPVRTVQLKEFDDKEEVMSKESKADVKESGEVKEKRKKENRSRKDDEETPEDGVEVVKTEPLSDENLKENDDKEEKEKETTATSRENDEKNTENEKNFVKTVPLSEDDLRDPKKNSDEAKENDDVDEDQLDKISPYPPNPSPKTEDVDHSTEENNSLDSDHADKSKSDNSFDSQQVDKWDGIVSGDIATEAPEEEIPTMKVAPAHNEDEGEEVGTVKTPEALRKEKKQLEKAKRRKDQRMKKVDKAEDKDVGNDDPNDPKNDGDDDSKGSKETANLFTLPTLPTLPPLGQSPPTLPPITPMPGLDNLLQTISKQWRKIFPSARIPTFNPEEDD
ncbi:lectin C-type domain protein [Necator americanus]|uniref:Lectin C-type domain protein n=1 Tax=Necator americanus TaxID=51031 RepID=W2TI89_NECAM|nr:lectin C-type domain protein [Necator americanus]ETN81805.1 lectin C-type domain protein [Necator americanus]